jgi:hypothetical protein
VAAGALEAIQADGKQETDDAHAVAADAPKAARR